MNQPAPFPQPMPPQLQTVQFSTQQEEMLTILGSINAALLRAERERHGERNDRYSTRALPAAALMAAGLIAAFASLHVQDGTVAMLGILAIAKAVEWLRCS